ncbi:MAG TPA: FliM/FliN family flagellar motor switch protein [Solirubrobacteraceae bacterium]
MSSTVDADRIAALMAAAGSQRRPADGETVAGRRPRWLRTVDFSRPTKFTTDQERRLTRAVEAFCRTGTSRLTAERVPCELELLDCSQHTWSNAQSHVPPGSVIALVGVEPLGTRVVLSAESTLLTSALEALLGGQPDRASRTDRKLTDIDLLLFRRVFETLVEALSSVFSDHAGVELSVNDVDPSGETTYLEQPSEPTLALTMEARLGRASTVMVLLLPYHAVEAVLGRFSGRDDNDRVDPDNVEAVRTGVSRVDVTVRAEVADRIMPVHEVLALKPGDVVKLGAAAGSQVTLYAEDVPVHRARPGRSGNHRAVQVLGPIEGRE